jgi:transposase
MTAVRPRRKGDLEISPHDRSLLVKWSRSRTLAARVVLRSRIVLMLTQGQGVGAVAGALGVAHGTARLWGQRFRESGAQALLHDAPGRGRKPALDSASRLALRNEPEVGDAPTLQQLARKLGVSASTVSRWRRRRGEVS